VALTGNNVPSPVQNGRPTQEVWWTWELWKKENWGPQRWDLIKDFFSVFTDISHLGTIKETGWWGFLMRLLPLHPPPITCHENASFKFPCPFFGGTVHPLPPFFPCYSHSQAYSW